MKSLLVIASVVALGGYVAIQHLTPDEARATPAVPHAGPVASITLDGQDLPLAALRSVLASHAGDALDPARLVQDRAAMVGALVARGYLAAAIKPPVITWADDAAYVSYDVQQGPLFRIRAVTVTGARDSDAVITIGTGDVAQASRIESARQTLADNLARRGKHREVSVTTTIDRGAGVVDVALATSNASLH